jgi:hypothetical protein
MKFASATAALIGAVLIAGCAGATIGLHSTSSPSIGGALPPGSSYGSASIVVDVPPGAFAGVLLLGYLAAGAQGDYQGRRYGSAGRNPPQMAEDRAVAERDCSRPIKAPSANLRCK